MDGCSIALLALAFVVGVPILIYAAHQTSTHREAEEFERFLQEKRKEPDRSDASAQDATNLWLSLKRSYPFLKTPELDEPTPDAIYNAIVTELYKRDTLGEHDPGGIAVPLLPLPARTRHLYVIGKTGSGKSTYLEHQIVRDIQKGWAVGVMSPEAEFFTERIFPFIHPDRWDDVVYFAPGDEQSPHTFNPMALAPGDDPIRASEDLFTIFRRVFTEDELGPRMAPLLQNAIAVLMGRPGVSLWQVKRLFEDPDFRAEIVDQVEDEYLRSFWENVYPRFPKNADLPIITRLDRFLRPAAMRRILCASKSTFSIADILSSGKLFFVNLFGLSQENRELFGQLLLSKFQLELMRRELAGGKHRPYILYADEFQSFAGVAEGTWRELLSRGRKYQLGLVLAHQFPAQLPTALQEEILGNVYSIVAFSLGGKDAQVVRRELLTPNPEKGGLEPVPVAALLDRPTGQAMIKFAGGHATRVRFPPPLELDDAVPLGRGLRAYTWQGISPQESTTPDKKLRLVNDPDEEPEEWAG